MQKWLITLGMLVGSTVGGYLPVLFGGSMLSFSGILFSVIGGVAGVWLGYKLGKFLGFD